jgi:hypothetical protein
MFAWLRFPSLVAGCLKSVIFPRDIGGHLISSWALTFSYGLVNFSLFDEYELTWSLHSVRPSDWVCY